MGAAHGHHIAQLLGQLFHIDRHALTAAAVDHGDKGSADQHTVCTQCQRLEDIQAAADAAVNENHHLSADSLRNLGQDLRRGRAAVQYAAAVIRHHDGACAGLQCFARTGHRHNALDDKGHLCVVDDFPQLLHRFAAGGRGQVFQEGQTCGIDVHGNSQRMRRLDGVQLGENGIPVPGLDGGHTAAARFFDGGQRALHHGGIGAVAGKGGNAGTLTGGYQNVVVSQVVVQLAVVQFHGAHRRCHNGRCKCLAEEGKGGIHRLVLADGVHVDAQFLPFLVIADKTGTQPLGARPGDGIFAARAVADGADLAVRAYARACILQNLLVVHDNSPF